MAILKSFVLIAALAAAGYFGYRFLRGNPYTLQQFQAIMNLTPEQLEANCGSPVQDSRGVVVENDGIRDLLYRDSGGSALVFRFISEDGIAWQSLGAWEQVNAPYDLGDPVAATDAAHRLPCAAKTAGSAFGINWQGSGTIASYAAILQDMPLTLPHSLPAPIHPPIPTITQTPNSTSSAAPSLIQRSYRSQRVRSNSVDEFGPGPENEGPKSGGAHCPTKDPCALFGYMQFVTEFKQAIQAEQENKFEQAMTMLTQHGVMVVQLPSVQVSRASAVKAIVQLELKTINIVEARLHDDVVHLEPIETQSTEIKSKKMTMVEHDDQQRRQMWKYAVEANRPEAGTSFSSSGSTFSFNSDAYLQLVQIHLSGNWPP
ncbi:MAG: hypothetical protein ACRD3S_04935 [Terracidiphilus sp.]